MGGKVATQEEVQLYHRGLYEERSNEVYTNIENNRKSI